MRDRCRRWTGGRGRQLRSGAVKELAAGKLLVAVRGLPDPNFSETVILLAEHGADGSMGLVINRRTDVPIARAFPDLKPAQGRLAGPLLGRPGGNRRSRWTRAFSGRGVRRAPDPGRRTDNCEPRGARGPDYVGRRTGPVPGVRRVRGLGSRAVGARDAARLVARLSGRSGRRVRPDPETALATPDSPDRGSDGASPPVALRPDRFAQRARRAETPPAFPRQPSAGPPRQASRGRAPRDRTATRSRTSRARG